MWQMWQMWQVWQVGQMWQVWQVWNLAYIKICEFLKPSVNDIKTRSAFVFYYLFPIYSNKMFDLISNGGVFCNGNLSSYKGDPFTNRREPTWLDPISGYPLGVTPLEVTPLGVNPLGMTDIEHENLEIPLPLTLFLPGSKTPYSYRGVWGGQNHVAWYFGCQTAKINPIFTNIQQMFTLGLLSWL